jgi:hypothetical protein
MSKRLVVLLASVNPSRVGVPRASSELSQRNSRKSYCIRASRITKTRQPDGRRRTYRGPLNRITMSAPHCVPDCCRRTCARDLRAPLVSASHPSVRNRRSKIRSVPCSSRAPSVWACDWLGRGEGGSSEAVEVSGIPAYIRRGGSVRQRISKELPGDLEKLPIRGRISASDPPDTGH